MRDRLLWYLSLLFIGWMIWAETSFQYFEQELGQSLNLDPGTVALVGSAFLLPYGLAQIPVGWLLDRGRAERLLLLGGIGAAAMTLAFSQGQTLNELIVSRAGMGLACAVAFPASGLLARRSLPPQRFALALGITDSLLGLGAALAALLPLMAGQQPWRNVVQLQSLVMALLVVIPLMLLVRSGRSGSSLAPPAAAEPTTGLWRGPGGRQLLLGILLYAWGGGLMFGLGQYALISRLQQWSTTLQLQVTLVFSLATMAGMLICGALGQRPQRRPALLLIGSLLCTCALVVLCPMAAAGPLQLLVGLLLGLGIGSCVLAFPIAEESAPAGRTAFVVAIVNTFGTITGGVTMVLSGQLLLLQHAIALPATLVFYGLWAMAGIPLALWQARSQHAQVR